VAALTHSSDLLLRCRSWVRVLAGQRQLQRTMQMAHCQTDTWGQGEEGSLESEIFQSAIWTSPTRSVFTSSSIRLEAHF